MLILQALVNGLVTGAFLALMGAGLALIFGILGIVNFAHGVLFMLGAYAVLYFTETLGWNYFLALPAAGVVVGLFGALLYRAVFRKFRELMLEGAVVAIGLALLLESLAWEVFSGLPRTVSSPFEGVLRVGGVTIATHRLFVVTVAVALIVLLTAFVRYSRYGRAMRAVQQVPYAASLQGIEIDRVSILAFGLGSMLAGVAGGLMAPLQLLLPGMGQSPILLAFVVIILGGMGSVGGSLVASVIIGLTLSLTTTFWTPQAAMTVSFLLAIVILLVRPTGLFGHE